MTREEYLALPYTIRLRADEDGDWLAEIDELEGCVAHGVSRDEALRRIDEAKTLWIDECLAHGQPIPKPNPVEELPSGRWVQRTPRSLHKNLARLAKVEGTSLNQLVTSILSEHVGSRKSAASTTKTAQAVVMNYGSGHSGFVVGFAVSATQTFAKNAVLADYNAITVNNSATTEATAAVINDLHEEHA